MKKKNKCLDYICKFLMILLFTMISSLAGMGYMQYISIFSIYGKVNMFLSMGFSSIVSMGMIVTYLYLFNLSEEIKKLRKKTKNE